MNEHDLMEALEKSADDLTVGPPPVAAMTRSAGRTRRRNGLLGGVAAVALVVAGTVGVAQGLSGSDPGTPAIAVQPDPVDVPPAGSTYVGMGEVAIAVPSQWAAGGTECNGVPQQSTFVADPPAMVCRMYMPFPADTDAVYVSMGEVDTSTWTPDEIDGADALRSPFETAQQAKGEGASEVTTASVLVAGVVFRVQSSVSAERVEELLDGITVLEGHVGVPGFADLTDGIDGTAADTSYRERVEAAGLVYVEVSAPRAGNPGSVRVASPRPGTVVDPGSTVTVQVPR